MEEIAIKGSDKTPTVIFKPGELIIYGRSVPDNSYEFFRPLIRAVQKYCAEEKYPTVIKITLDYISTGSSKCILDILKEFEKYFSAGNKTEVEWHYEEDDEDMEELGEDYKAIIDIPFNFTAHEE